MVTSWTDYLYRQHSPEQLRRWARSLRYFRFCRAYGGHNNDGDRLLVAIEDYGDIDLTRFQPAITYTRGDRLEIFVSDAYDVTEEIVNTAREIEPLLVGRIIDPPQDDEHCICPKYYPEFWD